MTELLPAYPPLLSFTSMSEVAPVRSNRVPIVELRLKEDYVRLYLLSVVCG